MRLFWSIIVGLLVAAGVVLFRPTTPTSGAPARTSDETSSGTPPTPARAEPSITDRLAATARDAATTATDEPPTDDDRITATTWTLAEGDTLQELARRRYGDARLWRRIVEANPALAAGELELGDEIVLPDLDEIPDAPAGEPAADAAALVADLDAGRGERAIGESPAASEADTPDVDDDAPTLELGLDREIPDATIAPGRLVRAGEAIVADGLYTIRGAGTRDDPYRVSWELLASCADGYRPSLGERSIPQRIAALDGQWIRIDGYVAFPLGGTESTELLVMLNQWDGCCIGIPPTPYDAIEATLVEPMPAGQRHAINFGSITGRLVVSPYLVENWLVGLYLMDDAEVRFEL